MHDRRSSRRFDVQLPVKLIRNGDRPLSGVGETKNLGSGGVFFITNTQIDIGESIEYTVSLAPNRALSLHCVGIVTRFELSRYGPSNPAGCYEVAATLERYGFVRGTLERPRL